MSNPQATKTYPVPNITKVTAKIKAMNGPAIDLTKPSGEVVTQGCDCKWSMANNLLTVTVVKKPLYISYGEVFNHLTSFFANV
jgi:hypothetical protein